MEQTEVKLKDLGSAAGLTVWGFRAAVLGKSQVREVLQSFEWAVGQDASLVLQEISDLVASLSKNGRRKVEICCTCCHGVSADELSLAAMLSAAQAERTEDMQSYAKWLYAGLMPAEAERAARRIGGLFLEHGLFLKAPEIAQIVSPRLAEVNWSAYVGTETGRA